MNAETAEILPGFACPCQQDCIFESTVSAHGQMVLTQALSEQATQLETWSPSLFQAISELSLLDDAFQLYWDPVLGDLHTVALGAHKDHATEFFAQLALLANSLGLLADWVAPVKSRRLRFDQWLLPQADELRITACVDSVLIQVRLDDSRQELQFVRTGDGWVHTGACEAMPAFRSVGFKTHIIKPEALSPSSVQRLLNADAYHFNIDDAQGYNAAWSKALRAAIELLQETSPEYLPWIDQVLKYVLPLSARAGTLNSGGEKFTPGVICLSNQPFEFPLAEMLVHEAAHQYMNVLTRLGPLENGIDTRLYHSPFRGKDRPIFFILVAYHAFANVLLLYRQARKAGRIPSVIAGYDGLEHREQTLERQLASIEPILRDSQGLTDLGHSLWVPLSEAMHEVEHS